MEFSKSCAEERWSWRCIDFYSFYWKFISQIIEFVLVSIILDKCCSFEVIITQSIVVPFHNWIRSRESQLTVRVMDGSVRASLFIPPWLIWHIVHSTCYPFKWATLPIQHFLTAWYVLIKDWFATIGIKNNWVSVGSNRLRENLHSSWRNELLKNWVIVQAGSIGSGHINSSSQSLKSVIQAYLNSNVHFFLSCFGKIESCICFVLFPCLFVSLIGIVRRVIGHPLSNHVSMGKIVAIFDSHCEINSGLILFFINNGLKISIRSPVKINSSVSDSA